MEDNRFLQWSRVSVYWQLCKTEGHFFAKSTFYKYCKVMGYTRRKGLGKCKKNCVGVKASVVGEIIHVDVTEVYAKNYEKAYILFVQDNFSRKIIGYHVAKENNSLLQAATIKKAINAMDNVGRIMADGGSENKGDVDVMLKTYFPSVQKIIAKVDLPFANNMVEALHYKIKHQIFPKDGFDCFDSVVTKLPGLVNAYNAMPHNSLNGGTPNEIFNGVFPDLVKRFEGLKNAGVVRLKFNKGLGCCGVV
jgi:putative transposase